MLVLFHSAAVSSGTLEAMWSWLAGPVSRDDGGGSLRRGPPALVAAVGHDKAGALAVLQQSIVPDLVTETPVTGLHALLVHQSLRCFCFLRQQQGSGLDSGIARSLAWPYDFVGVG